MKKLPITLYPDPLLRKKAATVDPAQIPDMQDLVDDMILTMKEEDGIGLAAPQVGKSIRLIVIAYKKAPLVLINPTISKLSFRKEAAEEGCLSIPGVSGIVKRHKHLTFSGHDRNGQIISGRAEGLFARVLQHEVDHINGILFIDRSEKITHEELT